MNNPVDCPAGVGVGVGMGIAVGVGVGMGIAVGVGVGIGIAVGVGVGMGIAVGVGVGVGIAVDVGVGIGIAVGAGIGVGVAAGPGSGETGAVVVSHTGVEPGAGMRVDPARVVGVVRGHPVESSSWEVAFSILLPGINVIEPAPRPPGSGDPVAGLAGRVAILVISARPCWEGPLVGSMVEPERPGKYARLHAVRLINNNSSGPGGINDCFGLTNMIAFSQKGQIYGA